MPGLIDQTCARPWSLILWAATLSGDGSEDVADSSKDHAPDNCESRNIDDRIPICCLGSTWRDFPKCHRGGPPKYTLADRGGHEPASGLLWRRGGPHAKNRCLCTHGGSASVELRWGESCANAWGATIWLRPVTVD